jgi:hypothetical protein
VVPEAQQQLKQFSEQHEARLQYKNEIAGWRGRLQHGCNGNTFWEWMGYRNPAKG